jgi:hypothetical protein
MQVPPKVSQARCCTSAGAGAGAGAASSSSTQVANTKLHDCANVRIEA